MQIQLAKLRENPTSETYNYSVVTSETQKVTFKSTWLLFNFFFFLLCGSYLKITRCILGSCRHQGVRQSFDATYLFFQKVCENLYFWLHSHCVKSVRIRSFFWSVFSCIRPGYGDLLCKSEYRKMRTRKNSVFGHFSCSVMLLILKIIKISEVCKMI